jgi:lysophospholipase L1-like esterase
MLLCINSMKPIPLLIVVLASLLGRLPAAEPIAAFAPGARILFQGDSITDGNRGRSPDPNHILGHGYAFIIAAKYGAAFAAMNLDFMNRGSSGNTVRDLQKRWQKDTLELKPDVLSILIGVNDQSHDVPLDEYERTYDELITQAKTGNPKLRLVLCEPFTLPVGKRKDGYEVWRAGIQARQDVVAKLAAKHDAALVRFQPVFEGACKVAPAEHWIWDGVHPTYSGHQLMADEWERAVRAKWPTP